MLSLQSSSPQRWWQQIEQHLDELLIDHAHCEKKAAGTAMNLIFAYVEHDELCREMAQIVKEELEHFELVLDLLRCRGVRFRRLKPSQYGRKLNDLVRPQEPDRAIDRLLVASLIEARSCERFGVLRERLADRSLAKFYDDLFESEARHHTTYVRLARSFGDDQQVSQRLAELSAEESRIIAVGEPQPRMHS